MRLCGARLFDLLERDRAPDLANTGEILGAHLPRNAERAQDLALGRLAAGTSLLDRVDRARGYTSLVGEVVLCLAQRLSGEWDPMHRAATGFSLPGFGSISAWSR